MAQLVTAEFSSRGDRAQGKTPPSSNTQREGWLSRLCTSIGHALAGQLLIARAPSDDFPFISLIPSGVRLPIGRSQVLARTIRQHTTAGSLRFPPVSLLQRSF